MLSTVLCPRCRTNAPLVYRGFHAYCSVCSAPRPLLSSASLTHAGMPHQLGGGAARAFAWVVLLLSIPVAALAAVVAGLVVGGLSSPAWGSAALVFGALFLPALLTWWLLRRKARRLEGEGESALRLRQRDALFSLAAVSGGVVRADRAAMHLGLSTAATDALLTELAKDDPSAIELDVTESGDVLYRFTALAPRPVARDGLSMRDPVRPARARIAVEPESSDRATAHADDASELESELDVEGPEARRRS
jgi:hypothetical protein